MYSLEGLESWSQTPRCRRPTLPQRPRAESFLISGGGLLLNHRGLCLCGHVVWSLCVSAHASSCKDISHWGPPSPSVCPPLNPMTLAMTLFPNKVPLTGARDHRGSITLAQGQTSVEWEILASSSGHPHSALGSGLSHHGDRCLHWDVRNWGLAEPA